MAYCLKQYKTGAFTGGLMDVSMEHLEELYNASNQPILVFYEEFSLDKVQTKLLTERFGDRLVLCSYKKGSPPPLVIRW